MKYYAVVDGEEFIVEIQDGTVTIDGEPVDVDLCQGGVPELYSMLLDGHSYELLIEDHRQSYTVTSRGEQFTVVVEDERTRRLNAGRSGPSAPQGEMVVKAPIPGLVVRVLVNAGDEVSEDQPLIILEAMKMENEIRAQRAGTVRKVEVAAGERVEQNGALLVIA